MKCPCLILLDIYYFLLLLDISLEYVLTFDHQIQMISALSEI